MNCLCIVNGVGMHKYNYTFLLLLSPLQNDSIVTSQWMQFIFWDKREVHLLDESTIPVTEKESMREGKSGIDGQNFLQFII